jgi:hypothetical protein
MEVMMDGGDDGWRWQMEMTDGGMDGGMEGWRWWMEMDGDDR